MPSTVASMAILLTANAQPAITEMGKAGKAVKDIGQTSQKEGKKTEGFMKRWGSSFAAIGAAATGALYMVIKASPLLSGAMREAQDAINLLFMTIGDALEPVIRPFVDALWGLSDLIIDMPSPFNTLTAALIALGGSITAVLAGLTLLPTLLHAVGLAAGAAASQTLLLSTALFGIVTAAGLVAAALYYVSGDPTLAIVGALTTIGIGATILLHNPLIFAVTSIISAFVLMTGEMSNMETLASAAFLSIGVAATALMGHPVVAAIVGIGGAIGILITSSADFEIKMVAVFTAIGIAAYALLANPVIAAVTAIVDAVLLLIHWWKELQGIIGAAPAWEQEFAEEHFGRPLLPGEHVFQYGGYVPYTGPAFLHAGEYVVPRGGAAAGAGPIYHVDYHPTIEITATLRDRMDVEELKRTLDEIYKSDMGRVA